MSKAFTKEQDADLDDDADIPAPQIPVGAKNYMTPAGARRMQEELRELLHKIRPEVVQTVSWAAGNGDRSENGDYIYGKKRLREIDRRVRFLSKRLDNCEVVDPLLVACDQVRFGATVTICDEEDRKKTYAIVGVDEADAGKGRISWASPLANALMKAREGDVVMFRSPRGIQEIEVVKIEYKPLEELEK
ncbi:MAG: transcription elongation factor GreB [Deltaproteobacteria bacterium]|nr:transcription elongation factor GreB [Deltaproteobacteria bacterium]